MGVRIKHFGGHIGSYAGDCAVISIEAQAQSEIVIIDTAASIVWEKNELKNYVRSQLTERERPVTLITTHFHADHYRKEGVKGITISRHIFSAAASEACQPELIACEQKPLAPGVSKIRNVDTGYLLKCYVPPDGDPRDQNDLSMAVYVEADNFSYFSFGDMTKGAYLRLVNYLHEHNLDPLPRAGVTKYPHHGNFALNYIAYYEQYMPTEVVIISGHSRSEVNKTIEHLLAYKVGAVYCIGRTADAKALFERLNVVDRPVYIAEDVILTDRGVELINGQFLTFREHQMGRRAKNKQIWANVEELSADSSSEINSMAED